MRKIHCTAEQDRRVALSALTLERKTTRFPQIACQIRRSSLRARASVTANRKVCGVKRGFGCCGAGPVAIPRGPYAAALWEIGSRINAIGAGPDCDEISTSERHYIRALEDVMMMIKVLQITGCPVCGGVLGTTQERATGGQACSECGTLSRDREQNAA